LPGNKRVKFNGWRRFCSRSKMLINEQSALTFNCFIFNGCSDGISARILR
jgi:hypothetical protein